jgi:hypothetical protein
MPPARRCLSPRWYAAGGPAGSGAMLPQTGPDRQQPAPPAGAGGAGAAGSAKAAVTTGPPGSRQTLIWSATAPALPRNGLGVATLVIGVRACAAGIRVGGGYTCPCATCTGHHPPHTPPGSR